MKNTTIIKRKEYL